MYTMGDFKVGVSVGVYCTKCTLNTSVNTNFEITQCTYVRKTRSEHWLRRRITKIFICIEAKECVFLTSKNDFILIKIYLM
jgi:hypothetical protein